MARKQVDNLKVHDHLAFCQSSVSLVFMLLLSHNPSKFGLSVFKGWQKYELLTLQGFLSDRILYLGRIRSGRANINDLFQNIEPIGCTLGSRKYGH
jgi:hypothetical protein